MTILICNRELTDVCNKKGLGKFLLEMTVANNDRRILSLVQAQPLNHRLPNRQVTQDELSKREMVSRNGFRHKLPVDVEIYRGKPNWGHFSGEKAGNSAPGRVSDWEVEAASQL